MNGERIKILYLEDLPTDVELVERELKRSSLEYDLYVVKTRKEFIKAFNDFYPDIILSDHNLPSFDSVSALKILRGSGLNIPFILVTSAMPDECAVEIMKEGADDYIIKDRLSRLPLAINKSLEKYKLAEEKNKLQHDILRKEIQIANAIVEAKELERSELGRELHDNVSQLLGAARLYIDMAKKDNENRDRFLAESSTHTYNALQEIKKLSRGMVKTSFEKGLCGAIDTIIKDVKEVNDLDISFRCIDVDGNINDKLSLNVFRIVQEQLNNILKHAKATKIKIDLSQNKSNLILSVRDNGVGFDTAKKYSGIGISNIITRAELYMGKANFISEPDKGCNLIVTIPLQGNINKTETA